MAMAGGSELVRVPYIVVDDQQAAQFFRSFDQRACQFEGGRMRWWFEANLRLELVPDGPGFGEWRLFVVPSRDCGASRDSEVTE